MPLSEKIKELGLEGSQRYRNYRLFNLFAYSFSFICSFWSSYNTALQSFSALNSVIHMDAHGLIFFWQNLHFISLAAYC